MPAPNSGPELSTTHWAPATPKSTQARLSVCIKQHLYRAAAPAPALAAPPATTALPPQRFRQRCNVLHGGALVRGPVVPWLLQDAPHVQPPQLAERLQEAGWGQHLQRGVMAAADHAAGVSSAGVASRTQGDGLPKCSAVGSADGCTVVSGLKRRFLDTDLTKLLPALHTHVFL